DNYLYGKIYKKSVLQYLPFCPTLLAKTVNPTSQTTAIRNVANDFSVMRKIILKMQEIAYLH
ncbi:hypothetical protein, partial [Acetobacter orientalis]|uniref:hypothetical protein n=1 Tax=Acetobacter orientalis TaxID=146474 RepID=UPI0039E81E65